MERCGEVEALVNEHWSWARGLARSWWRYDEANEAESAAGEAIVLIATKYLEEGSELPFRFYATVRLRTFLIDEWRKRHGRKPETRQRRTSVSLHTPILEYEDLLRIDQVTSESHEEVGTHVEVMELLLGFPGDACTILVAVAAGWKQNEIGELWGVTESRISQILAKERCRCLGKLSAEAVVQAREEIAAD